MKQDEEKNVGRVPTICERSIWKFYEWAVIFAPLLLMLSHWYIFYVFSQNPYELLHYSSANEICIAWIYTILYLYVPLMILPASYFFKWCNIFRIPFVYFAFINMERLYYGSWFCTNEMVDTHYILILCVIGLYLIELVGILLKYKKRTSKLWKMFVVHIRGQFRSNPKEEDRYNKTINILKDVTP